MVVLSASICTRGGKAVLARQFREMPRSRVEALLASFPKLADSGLQHTTVEQDNVRFVYQPLDELYIVLITNRQSNILQDIDSLHLFAQVVSSICKTLDEREILRNAYELLSAFDEVVTMGLRENLTISQIKTFLEMDSHEERIQEIIQRNKELEAAEEKKRKMKQMELQKKEAMRNARNNIPSTPSYPKYVPPATPVMTQTYDSYAAEKNKTKTTITRGKGMQLGKKSKPSEIFEQLKSDLGPEVEETTPLVQATQQLSIDEPEPLADSSENPVQLTIAENISARISREGALQSFSIKGDLQLRVLDPSMSKIKLDLLTEAIHGAQFRTHPNVDKPAFTNSKIIQLRDTSRGFPPNNSVGVLRWNAAIPSSESSLLPLAFTVWVNKGSGSSHTITVEYEFSGDSALSDVTLSIPFSSGEPTISSFDANYEMTENSVEWKVGDVDESNASGSFEIEAEADDESEFFPMRVNFSKSQPIIPVDVASVSLIELGQEIPFEKVVQSVADSYVIE